MKREYLLFVSLVVLSVASFFLYKQFTAVGNRLINIPLSSNISSDQTATGNLEDEQALSTFAKNLNTPWGMDLLPDGTLIVTERPGRISLIDITGNVIQIADINVREFSESGLHGVAVDPDFTNNNFIYLYHTYISSLNQTLNRVVRYILEDNSLSSETVIVDNIPGAPNHDGGRIKFGPDGYLYITTGDAQSASRAQDINSLAGKILRVTKNGEVASGNPFGTLIYSYGHRNPQGITWDNDNNLWATEHGRSGVLSGLDELNLIKAGSNYGWPEIEGDETKPGMTTPIIHSGASTTWAPAGAAYLNGSIFFTGLRGQTLYEFKIAENIIVEHLSEKLGRLRNVVVGPDGFLYLATSNRDGRGNPGPDDDMILKINPQKLSEL